MCVCVDLLVCRCVCGCARVYRFLRGRVRPDICLQVCASEGREVKAFQSDTHPTVNPASHIQLEQDERRNWGVGGWRLGMGVGVIPSL